MCVCVRARVCMCTHDYLCGNSEHNKQCSLRLDLLPYIIRCRYVGRIEAAITGSDGFAVGSALTLADVLIFSAFAEVLSEEQVRKLQNKLPST